jgi:hypothetical protein
MIDTLPHTCGKAFLVSWTEIFPVLDEDHLEQYEASVTREEREEFEGWFGINEIFPAPRITTSVATTPQPDQAPRPQLVSATLFWKHVGAKDPELPRPSREFLVDARRLGLVKRFSPWESYIEPLVTRSAQAMEENPDVRFRLYLASDLDFLIPELNNLGWDVYLMKGPSVRYCPGGFWRFLPLEEEGTLVTVIDTDRMNQVSNEIVRTRSMDEMGLGLWRVPGYYNSDLTKQVRYRPILGGHFGARGGIPVRKLIEAFIWHSRRDTLRKTAFVPGIGERPIMFAEWPGYGFDEWFQLAAIYPRLVRQGTLTFIPVSARSLLLPVDLEYVTWANPRSESIYV